MLTRAARSAHVCLKPRSQAFTQTAALSAGRAAREQTQHGVVETGDVVEDDYRRPHGESPPLPTSPPSRLRDDDFKPNDYRFRKWRPSQTADLGVNALGKPAKVLILPIRDRRIPKVPKDEDVDNAGRRTVQDFLESENAPLSLKDLVANIEDVRNRVDKRRGQLDMQEWDKLKKELRQGFRSTHLRRYIESLHQSPRMGMPVLPRKNLKGLIRYLVEEVWGYTIPQQPDVLEKTKEKSLDFPIGGRLKIEYLLSHASAYLRKLAEDNHVVISSKDGKPFMRVRGPHTKVRDVGSKILKHAQNLEIQVVSFDGPLGQLCQDPGLKASVRAFVPTLEQKHEVRIDFHPGKVTLVQHKEARGVHQAHRDLCLAHRAPTSSQAIATFQPASTASRALIPFSAPPDIFWNAIKRPWSRLVDLSPHSAVPSPPDDDSFRQKQIDSLAAQLRDFFAIPRIQKPVKGPGDPFYETTAKFGSALLSTDSWAQSASNGSENMGTPADATRLNLPRTPAPANEPTSIPEATKEANSRLTQPMPTISALDASLPPQHLSAKTPAGSAWLVGQIPFATQQVAQMKPWTPASEVPMVEGSPSPRLVLRLELLPKSPTHRRDPGALIPPNLEVFVTAGEASTDNEATGVKMGPFDIARITAVLQSKSFVVLCPAYNADIEIVQQLRQDLLFPTTKPGAKPSALTSAIKKYVDMAQSRGKTVWSFAPFVNLPVPRSLFSKNSPDRMSHSVGSQYGPVGKSTSRPPEDTTKYILKAVEVINVDARQLDETHHSNSDSESRRRCLDYVTLTGIDATKHELRLSGQSLFYRPDSTQPSPPDDLLVTALDLASQLGYAATDGPTLRKTYMHRLSDGHQSQDSLAPRPKAEKSDSRGWKTGHK